MKILTRFISILLCLFFSLYLLLPNPDFPEPPPDSVQSGEMADTETSLRRAYFTNYTREEVMVHYTEQFNKSRLFNIPLLTYRLNYPPEESQTLIRDQTMTTFLEEIVHPFRETIFVNGFEPKELKDDVWYKGVDYRQKIIIRFIPSNTLARLIIGMTTLFLAGFIGKEWFSALKGLRKKAQHD